MGLLMPKVGMRTGCNFPCNSAGGVLRPLYFGARMGLTVCRHETDKS
ncbi:hypothetical protein C4K27_0135 [Pseudomonas chlororaphis subsp. chlororaphis]|nr:hypothetical protein C4K27_0135 [Pseudomonas chlororaphis subsp. chlororaphis]